MENKAGASMSTDQAIRKCLKAFKRASNDNEKFASLLLVTSLLKADDVNEESKRMLYNAIGTKFILRLIRSSSSLEDCSPLLFKCIGMSVLVFFADSCVVKETFIEALPSVLSILADLQNEDVSDPNFKSLFEDCCNVILFLVRDPFYSDLILQDDSFKLIVNHLAYEKHTISNENKLLRVIIHLCYQVPKDMFSSFKIEMTSIMTKLAYILSLHQNKESFEICKILNPLLQLSYQEKVWASSDREKDFINSLQIGISGILKSKLKDIQYQDALQLATVLIQSVGVAITGIDEKDIAFIQLLVARSLVEVNVAISDSTSNTFSLEITNMLSSCFSITENCIIYLCNKDLMAVEDNNDEFLKSNKLEKLHNLLLEIVTVVISYLKNVSENPDITLDIACQSDVICGAFRVVCAWISEETSALQKDIVIMLPYLLQLCAESLEAFVAQQHNQIIPSDDNNPRHVPNHLTTVGALAIPGTISNDNLFQLLLPGLCHMSADETICPLLFQENITTLMEQYFDYCYKKIVKKHVNITDDSDLYQSFETFFGILLNFSITSPNKCMKDSMYEKVFIRIEELIRFLDSTQLALIVNVSTLYLIIIRWISNGQTTKANISSYVIKHYLSILSKSEKTIIADDNLIQLWLIGIDNLNVACKSDKSLCLRLIKDDICDHITDLMFNVALISNDHVSLIPLTLLKETLIRNAK